MADIFSTNNYYAIINCTTDDFNKNVQLEDPNRAGFYAVAKQGVPLNVFTHDGKIMVSLMYSMKAQFKQ